MAEDTTPPQVTEFSFTPTSVNASNAPAHVVANIRVTDDLSGVQDVRLTFVSPSGVRVSSGFKSHAFGVSVGGINHFVSGDYFDGVHEPHVTIPQYSAVGTWHVDTIYVKDRTGNEKTYTESELIALGFNTQFTVLSSETVWTFTDSFNRSNGAVGNGWQAIATGLFTGKTPVISSNRLAPSASAGRYGLLRPESLLDSVQEVTQVSPDAAFGGGGILFARMQNDQNGYCCIYADSGSGGGIYKFVNNTLTLISTATTRTPAANDRLRFTVQGSNLKFEILAGDTVVSTVTATDTTFTTAGKCGLGESFGGAVLDDYSLTELSS